MSAGTLDAALRAAGAMVAAVDAVMADEPRVMICSTFQSGQFPPLDPPSRATRDIHEALPALGYAEEFRARVRADWVPGLTDFAPRLVMVSAGFDARVEDDMGHADMVDADYEWVTRQLLNVAAASASGRSVSVLEGGYALSALGRSAACHVRALMGL